MGGRGVRVRGRVYIIKSNQIKSNQLPTSIHVIFTSLYIRAYLFMTTVVALNLIR